MATLDFEVHLDIDEIVEMLKEQGWRPVKHGHFTAYWHGSDKPVTYSCSVCGFHNTADTQYCPHCGAMMDGENDEID